jgi:hypothetical protein
VFDEKVAKSSPDFQFSRAESGEPRLTEHHLLPPFEGLSFFTNALFSSFVPNVKDDLAAKNGFKVGWVCCAAALFAMAKTEDGVTAAKMHSCKLFTACYRTTPGPRK